LGDAEPAQTNNTAKGSDRILSVQAVATLGYSHTEESKQRGILWCWRGLDGQSVGAEKHRRLGHRPVTFGRNVRQKQAGDFNRLAGELPESGVF